MLAIVIPYFKINFFKETLESLALQTDQRFTVYIGDDASPDAPEELLKKFEGKFNFIYKKFSTNLGSVSLVKQWERCINMMEDEEWFMLLGDDDLLSENVVKEFYQELSELEKISCVVRFASVLINEKSDKISGEFHHPKLEKAIDSYCRKLKGETRSSLSEYILRKSSYDKFGFKNYNLAWSSDDKAVIDFSENKPIYSLNSIIYVRMSEFNISSKKDNINSKIQGRLQCTKEILFEYQSIMTNNQIKLFIGLYENLIYRVKKITFNDAFKLLFYSYKYFGTSYTINQFKSLFNKVISRKVMQDQ
jgi:glycosyltransferase involved in cell wall biosynthesis